MTRRLERRYEELVGMKGRLGGKEDSDEGMVGMDGWEGLDEEKLGMKGWLGYRYRVVVDEGKVGMKKRLG